MFPVASYSMRSIYSLSDRILISTVHRLAGTSVNARTTTHKLHYNPFGPHRHNHPQTESMRDYLRSTVRLVVCAYCPFPNTDTSDTTVRFRTLLARLAAFRACPVRRTNGRIERNRPMPMPTDGNASGRNVGRAESAYLRTQFTWSNMQAIATALRPAGGLSERRVSPNPSATPNGCARFVLPQTALKLLTGHSDVPRHDVPDRRPHISTTRPHKFVWTPAHGFCRSCAFPYCAFRQHICTWSFFGCTHTHTELTYAILCSAFRTASSIDTLGFRSRSSSSSYA